ncbi:c-type cytochrome [Tropicimonas aquimaris]|uniref:C-type cytochrome n=1 Tax=Tropicimonas aquimaris TaxID=914152 RepID=A0ABW3ITF8_9RHOB
MTQINDIGVGQAEDPVVGSEPAMNPLFTAFVSACVLLVPGSGRAEEAVPPPESYVDACLGCHGADARGNGPNAGLLTATVPDLTTFAQRNDGVFDAARVVRLIDGREGLAAHGGPMPMFGGLLAGASVVIDGPQGSPVTTTRPILEIAEWLETVQVQ